MSWIPNQTATPITSSDPLARATLFLQEGMEAAQPVDVLALLLVVVDPLFVQYMRVRLQVCDSTQHR